MRTYKVIASGVGFIPRETSVVPRPCMRAVEGPPPVVLCWRAKSARRKDLRGQLALMGDNFGHPLFRGLASEEGKQDSKFQLFRQKLRALDVSGTS